MAYLILNSRAPQSRQHTAFLFWPERSEKQAFANLRQRLFHLRKTIPDCDQFILTDDQTIQWNPDASFIFDVAEFERFIAMVKGKKAGEHSEDRESALREAVRLYRGKLFIDCYEEWIIPFREQLHQKYIWALNEIVNLFEHKRDYSQAVNYTRKLLSEDPYDEKSYRTMMRLQALTEDRAKAIRTYRECEKILRRELDIKPGIETTTLYTRILNNSEFGEYDSNLNPTENKPDEKEKLIGRSAEWGALLNSWRKALRGNMHMLIITGDPGIGKTRLALELLNYVGNQGYPASYAKSYEAGESLSFGPVINWLRSDRVRGEIENLESVWISELVRIIPELLEQHPELSHPGSVQESWQRNRFFEAISKAILGNEEPRLLLLDDLQWCDGQTLSWLNYLFHSGLDAKVLIIGMMRPVEAAFNETLNMLLENLRREERLSQITLEKLSEDETVALASRVADRQLETDLGRHIFQETEGNPLFIIETVREGRLMETVAKLKGLKEPSDYEELTSERALPKKITEVITVRFRKVSKEAGDLIGSAATIGREFSKEMLFHINATDDKKLINLLEELQRHNIIQRELGIRN